jgi:hypothetical protein
MVAIIHAAMTKLQFLDLAHSRSRPPDALLPILTQTRHGGLLARGRGYSPRSMARSSRKRIFPVLPPKEITKRTCPCSEVLAYPASVRTPGIVLSCIGSRRWSRQAELHRRELL